MKKKNVIRLLFLLMIMGLFQSCNSEPLNIIDIDGLWVPSIKEIYPDIKAKAEELDPKSKLRRLSINLFPGNGKVNGVFFQFDDVWDDEFIDIWYFKDGSIIGEVENLEINIDEFFYEDKNLIGIETIAAIIDSPEALSLMIDYAELDSSYRNRLGCSSLILDRYSNPDFDPVIWMLVLQECEGEVIRQIEIDAKTGELLRIE